MVRLNFSKYDTILIPIKDERHIELFNQVNSATWVYYKDGKRHGRIPKIVGHGLEDLVGGEDVVRAAGYTKHWMVFEDHKTGKTTFGNYGSFISSPDPNDRLIAENMYEVDIDFLSTL